MKKGDEIITDEQKAELRNNVLKIFIFNRKIKGLDAGPNFILPDNKNNEIYEEFSEDITEVLEKLGVRKGGVKNFYVSGATLHALYYIEKNFTLKIITNLQRYAASNKAKEAIETSKIDPKGLNEYIDELYKLYNITFQIVKGCNVAKRALQSYPTNSDIVHWWVLFHNRNMQWGVVRETLQNIVNRDNIDEKTIQICYLGIFESYLNDSIWLKDHTEIKNFETLKSAKEMYLDKAPDKNHSQYLYFLARYKEAEWWFLPTQKGKERNMYLLESAFKVINGALESYIEKSNSGYPSVPWWLNCHKAMLCKILKHDDFETTTQEFYDTVMPEINKDPRTLKKSLYMYAATYYLMNADAEGLTLFLNKSIEVIFQRIIDLNLPKCNNDSNVESYPYHHCSMIFWKKEDEKLKEKYIKILQDFQKKCPW
ncbi:MAG: hypothetical protein PSV16_00525 [Flavobacterium sp.]|nr:hypothetical protein [Flavobacterium sp.]